MTAAKFKPSISCVMFRLDQWSEQAHYHDFGWLLLAACIFLLCNHKHTEFLCWWVVSLYNLEAGQKLGTGRDSWCIVRRYCSVVNTTLPGYWISQHVGGFHGRLPQSYELMYLVFLVFLTTVGLYSVINAVRTCTGTVRMEVQLGEWYFQIE
jgi:hypothetical protein